MPSMISRLWNAYNTEFQNYRQEFHSPDYDESMSDYEFLCDFLDHYFIYTREAINTVRELFDSSFINNADVNEAIEMSESIETVAYILSKIYLEQRISHENSLRRAQEDVRRMEENNRPSQPMTDEYPHEQEKEVYLYADFVDEDDI